jgi:hypothetical protein
VAYERLKPTYIYIYIYGFGFSSNVINARLWSVRPKREAYIDESNETLLWLTAVIMLVLIRFTTTGRIPQKKN